ncbi:MAG: amidohydrolase family protein [Actinobacteria bacterium]|nr:amidohydrolase family protein [Actinomycetota bacterium]
MPVGYSEEREPPVQFGHRHVPMLVVEAGRAYRRWRAKGPRLGDYAPASTLEVPVTPIQRACFPAVNFHTHLGRWLSPDGSWTEQDVRSLLDLMDACNVESMVNLDGRWGRELEENLERYDRAHPARFFTFCHVDWRLLERPEGPELLAKSLERSVAAGARGLKVWKDIGTQVRAQGRLVLPDDERLAPLWEAAGSQGVPVLMHVADPVAFFSQADRSNERLEELLRWRQQHRGGKERFHKLIGAVETVVARHSGTTFVAAHGLYPENLSYLAGMFERYPNFFVDIAWVHLQLGRQPRAARDLFLRYPGRIVFGTDVFPLREGLLRIYFRFLETADEYFSYTDEPLPGSGRWNIYGLDLPSEVLEKVYSANANALLGMGPGKNVPA